MANGTNLKREKEEKGGCRILRLISKAHLDVTASQPPLVAQGVRWILYVGPVRSRSFPFLSVCCRDGTRASDGRAIVLIHHHNNLIFQIIACFAFPSRSRSASATYWNPPSHPISPPPLYMQRGDGQFIPEFCSKAPPVRIALSLVCGGGRILQSARARRNKLHFLAFVYAPSHIAHTHTLTLTLAPLTRAAPRNLIGQHACATATSPRRRLFFFFSGFSPSFFFFLFDFLLSPNHLLL